MKTRKNSFSLILVLLFIIAWSGVTILAMTWGFIYDWPDNLHLDHGIPLVWATHTLNTIAGPVDRWRVDLSVFIVDLAFWLTTMIVIIAILLYRMSEKKIEKG